MPVAVNANSFKTGPLDIDCALKKECDRCDTCEEELFGPISVRIGSDAVTNRSRSHSHFESSPSALIDAEDRTEKRPFGDQAGLLSVAPTFVHLRAARWSFLIRSYNTLHAEDVSRANSLEVRLPNEELTIDSVSVVACRDPREKDDL